MNQSSTENLSTKFEIPIGIRIALPPHVLVVFDLLSDVVTLVRAREATKHLNPGEDFHEMSLLKGLIAIRAAKGLDAQGTTKFSSLSTADFVPSAFLPEGIEKVVSKAIAKTKVKITGDSRSRAQRLSKAIDDMLSNVDLRESGVFKSKDTDSATPKKTSKSDGWG